MHDPENPPLKCPKCRETGWNAPEIYLADVVMGDEYKEDIENYLEHYNEYPYDES